MSHMTVMHVNLGEIDMASMCMMETRHTLMNSKNTAWALILHERECMCSYVRAGMAGFHWLHAEWVERRKIFFGREGSGRKRRSSLGPPVGAVRCALSHTFLCKRGSAGGGSSRAGMLPAH